MKENNKKNETTSETAQQIQGLADTDYTVEFPIDLNLDSMIHISLPEIRWENFDSVPSSMKITNTGKSVILTTHWGNKRRPFISGGPLLTNYAFSQLNFLWGRKDFGGGKHTYNRKTFPLEIHALFIKCKYRNREEALKHKDGAIVLVFASKIAKQGDPAMDKVCSSLSALSVGDSSNSLQLDSPIRVGDLVHQFSTDYFLYWGTITTMACNHLLLWMVCRKPFLISQSQVHHFRRLMTAKQNYVMNNTQSTARIHPNFGRVFHINPSRYNSDVLYDSDTQQVPLPRKEYNRRKNSNNSSCISTDVLRPSTATGMRTVRVELQSNGFRRPRTANNVEKNWRPGSKKERARGSGGDTEESKEERGGGMGGGDERKLGRMGKESGKGLGKGGEKELGKMRKGDGMRLEKGGENGLKRMEKGGENELGRMEKRDEKEFRKMGEEGEKELRRMGKEDTKSSLQKRPMEESEGNSNSNSKPLLGNLRVENSSSIDDSKSSLERKLMKGRCVDKSEDKKESRNSEERNRRNKEGVIRNKSVNSTKSKNSDNSFPSFGICGNDEDDRVRRRRMYKEEEKKEVENDDGENGRGLEKESRESRRGEECAQRGMDEIGDGENNEKAFNRERDVRLLGIGLENFDREFDEINGIGLEGEVFPKIYGQNLEYKIDNSGNLVNESDLLSETYEDLDVEDDIFQPSYPKSVEKKCFEQSFMNCGTKEFGNELKTIYSGEFDQDSFQKNSQVKNIIYPSRYFGNAVGEDISNNYLRENKVEVGDYLNSKYSGDELEFVDDYDQKIEKIRKPRTFFTDTIPVNETNFGRILNRKDSLEVIRQNLVKNKSEKNDFNKEGRNLGGNIHDKNKNKEMDSGKQKSKIPIKQFDQKCLPQKDKMRKFSGVASKKNQVNSEKTFRISFGSSPPRWKY